MAFLDQYAPQGAESQGELPPEPLARKFLDDYRPPAEKAPGLLPQAWEIAKYAGKRGLQGALQFIGAAEAGNPLTAVLLPETHKTYDKLAQGDLAGKLVGLPTEPPNETARVLGAAANGIGQFPVMPMASALGGVGGEYGGLPGAIAGGIAGSKLAQIPGRIANALNPPPSALEQLTSRLGNGTTWEHAGVGLRDSAAQHLADAIPQLERHAWAPLDEALPGTPVPPTRYLQTLEDLRNPTRAGPLAGSVSATRPGIVDTLYQQAAPLRPQLDSDLNPMPGTEEIPLWEHMQYFRSALGDAMQNPKNALFNLGKQQKSALYGSVTEDMKDVARTAELADEFTQANTTSKALRDHAEQFISPLVKDNQTPEKIIDWALGEARKGGTRLAALRDVMPTEMDNVAAVLLRKEPRAWGKMASSAQEALIPDPVLRAQVSESVARMFPTKGQGEIKSLGDKIVGSEIGAAIGLGMHSLVPGLSELQAGALGQVGGLLAPSLRKIGAATINGTGNALLPGFIGAEVGGRGRGDNAE